MRPRQLHAVQIGLGLVAVLALVAYGLAAAPADPIFWVFAVVFVSFMALDAYLHLRALGNRSG